MKHPLLFLLLPLLLLPGICFADSATVTIISDGDTLTVTQNGKAMKVRVYGIDCPESGQRFGPQAADYVSKLALFQEVKLQVMNTDRYDRSVALVALPDGRLLNELLLDEGLAWVYPDYCKDPRCAGWLLKEQLAKTRGKGLWSEKNPLPPWKWRQQNK